MLEWARLRPDDGHLLGLALRLRGPRPSAERLAALIRARLPLLPALAEQLDGPARQEIWRKSDTFDAAQHVHLVASATPAGHAAEQAANQPMPEDRPRWGLWILDTERDDEYLLAYRAHHAAQDGAAAAYTISKLLDPRGPAPAQTAVSLTDDHPPPVPPGPRHRLLATADIPLNRMRAISRTSGASLNDIYLAALTGALRAWLPATDHSRPIHVRVPFNLRLRHERQDRGNRMGYTRIRLPADEPRPAQQLAAIVEQTSQWPRDRARRVLDRMPPHMIWQDTLLHLTSGDALASATLLGINTPLALDGAPVTHSAALPPIAAGHLFAAALFLHDGRATISFTARAQHTHVRDLPRLWTRALNHLATALAP